MITVPMRCKLCGKIISPPDEALIIGQPPQVRNQKIIQKLMAHMLKMVEEEQKPPTIAHPDNNRHMGGPHLDRYIEITLAAQNFNGALIIGTFEISQEMEEERARVLARVHELSRTVRMSDEELSNLATAHHWDFRKLDLNRPKEWDAGSHHIDVMWLLQDLRDRYEGLGKYAPATQEKVKP